MYDKFNLSKKQKISDNIPGTFARERVLSWVRFPEVVTSKISLIRCSE